MRYNLHNCFISFFCFFNCEVRPACCSPIVARHDGAALLNHFQVSNKWCFLWVIFFVVRAINFRCYSVKFCALFDLIIESVSAAVYPHKTPKLFAKLFKFFDPYFCVSVSSEKYFIHTIIVRSLGAMSTTNYRELTNG